MKFSEHWLRTWANPDLTVDELAERLTMAGLELESLTPAAADFSGVIIGEVIEVAPHPDADRLQVCQVNVGKETLNIVCGAKNVRKGLKVAVATVGAILPGDFKIKQAKLRGVESCGMICSVSELGLAKDSDGIMELVDDAPIGQSIREYLQLDDVIVELGITPNRGDCLSISGIARDVAAITKCEFKPVDHAEVAATIADTFPVQINAAKFCPRYCGRVIRNINPVAQTPLWMQERLRRSEIKSISAIVDVTNYVMLELGQPMHAFDLGKLHDGIQVRYAAPKEHLTLLDEQQLTLTPTDVVIADKNKALALAGVMGGLDSGVTETTTDLFLESAFFNPAAVAISARNYGLHTDSSHRFERGVDSCLQLKAIERATELIIAIAGGEPGPSNEVIYEKQLPQLKVLQLRRERIGRVLGLEIPDSEVVGILQRLGFKVESTKNGWQVIVPSFRSDVEQEIDLIEELVRVYGYEKVPTHKPTATLVIEANSQAKLSLARIRTFLVDKAYHEVLTYSFVDPKLQHFVNPEFQAVPLQNPIASDMAVMRTSTWPGLLKTVLHNQRRQQQRIRLFETGLCFAEENKAIQQYAVLGGVVTGNCYPEQWGAQSKDADFFDVKSDLQALLQLTGKTVSFKPETHPALHPGKCARIYCAEKPLGYLGELNPSIKQKLGLNGEIYLFELDLALLSEATVRQFQQISKFPQVRRDLALVVDEEISAQQLLAAIFAKGGDLLRDVQIFDVYQGENITSGKKSIALSLILQHGSRTLVDSEIDDDVQRILTELKQEFNVILRG